MKKSKISLELDKEHIRDIISKLFALQTKKFSDKYIEVIPSLNHRLVHGTGEEIRADIHALKILLECMIEDIQIIEKQIKILPKPPIPEEPEYPRTLPDGSTEMGKIGPNGSQILPDGSLRDIE